MANVKNSYPGDTQLTITLASLATSATKVAGREGTFYDNTSNLYTDARVSGKITTGTTPTDVKTIEVWIIAPLNDTPTWPDVFDGTDSAETATSRGILESLGRLGAIMPTDGTSDRTYFFDIGSVAALFGGFMPSRFTVFVTHDTAVNLNATGGNHEVSVEPVFQTVT